MKRIFCKIFELPDNYQVLIRIEENEDGYGLVQETDLEGVHPKITLEYDNEVNCEACFNKYSEQDAKSFFDYVQKMFENHG